MMRREALPILYAKGVALAATAWKALLLALLVNAGLAIALAGPVENALHRTLDASPWGATLQARADATFFSSFTRRHPDVLGDLSTWEKLVTGTPVTEGLASGQGLAGSLLFLGLLNALVASVLAGGFAGRLGSDRDRASLSAFGADCGRFAFSSLVLGVISIGAIVAAYRLVFAASARLYEPTSLRYEWEAVALSLLRLGAFLVVAGFIRTVLTFARAAMGLSRNGNPFRALASGLAFVAGRPVKTLLLEVAFGATALVPLAIWGLFGPVWDGGDLRVLVLLVAAQQVIVLVRLASRVAFLGAAASFLRRVAEVARPAPEKIEGPATP